MGLFTFQNAFPVSGQLYTTHLLSLDALLTVIDSTEAHCQAKVLNTLNQQEKKETARPGFEAVDGNPETNKCEHVQCFVVTTFFAHGTSKSTHICLSP